MEDRERFEARRCETSLSREMSLCAMELDWEAEGESEAWLLVMGEADIGGSRGMCMVFPMSRLALMHHGELHIVINLEVDLKGWGRGVASAKGLWRSIRLRSRLSTVCEQGPGGLLFSWLNPYSMRFSPFLSGRLSCL